MRKMNPGYSLTMAAIVIQSCGWLAMAKAETPRRIAVGVYFNEETRYCPSDPEAFADLKKLTGRHPSVARYIRSFPQTKEFIERISELLIYLLPHYIREGKSYLTISFGCTGGHHRSVMMADQIRKNLVQAGFKAKVNHRDVAKTK